MADLVLQDLETKAINLLPTRLPFYYRYVDDIFFAGPANYLNNVLEMSSIRFMNAYNLPWRLVRATV